MSLEPRMWINDCGKCNGRWAGRVKPAYSNAVEYVRMDEVERMLLAEREAGRRDRDPDLARLCNEIEELEVRCGLRIK
jgi:hypothetical protein